MSLKLALPWRVAVSAALTTLALGAAPAAQAVVVDDGAAGQFGVALVPSTRAYLDNYGIARVTSSSPCQDPRLSKDLGGPALPAGDLCWRGGAVMHSNEAFDLTWDPLRRYWATTRDNVEGFLKDVATGSGTLTSPYSVTAEYTDASGRAQNASLYGGGCIDYGATGGSACTFGSSGNTFAQGQDYPANGCAPAGYNQFGQGVSLTGSVVANDVCLTDAQIKGYLSGAVAQDGLVNRIQPGHDPMIVLMTPPGVVVCLDDAGSLCSANGQFAPPAPTLTASTAGGSISPGTYQVALTYVTSSGESVAGAASSVTTTSSTQNDGTASIRVASPPQAGGVTGYYVYVTQPGGTIFSRQEVSGPTPIGTDVILTAPPSQNGPQPPPNTRPSFCSYHSQVNVSGTQYEYVVQPWTALSGVNECDEPDVPPLSDPPSAQELATNMALRLLSPISQSQIAAIVNPGLNGWVANTGAEVNDNGGCVPLPKQLDKVPVGTGTYLLQREFNNAAGIESDPNALTCVPNTLLTPRFVVPSNVHSGATVAFDGSITVSSLIVPYAGYTWNFGDGKSSAVDATGPSVSHTYKYGGTYTVTMTVVDRGANKATLTQQITVDGPPNPNSAAGSGGSSGAGLRATIQLLPQALSGALRNGVQLLVRSNQAADGIASITIPRATARLAGLTGGGPAITIGRGTVASLTAGTTALRIRIPAAIARKLGRLHHATLTVRLVLIGAGRSQVAVQAAGRY